MYFSISNLMIIYMTVVVIFVNGYLEVTTEKCQDYLRSVGFDTINTPFYSLSKFVNEDIKLIEHPKKKFKNLKDLVPYKMLAEFHIKMFYKNLIAGDFVPSECASKYMEHLVENILDSDNMLSIITWCDINVFNKDDLPEFIREESATKFRDENMYSKYYIKRIVNNTGLPKNNQLTYFKTLRVCFNEAKHEEGEEKHKDRPFKTFNRSFNSIKSNGFNFEPLSWCATQICYDSLIKSGFQDVKVEQNINFIFPETKSTKTSKGRYASQFNKYLQRFIEYNEKKDYYEVVSPYESNMSIHYGYLRNWCSVQVCYDDLIAAGFVYLLASDNYFNVCPKYENNKLNLSNYIISYCDHLKFISKHGVLRYMVDPSVHPSFNIPTNVEPRSPKDFCLFHIIKPEHQYFSYIKE